MSDNPAVPDAAVEAAARGMLTNSNWGDRWDDLSDLHKGWWRAQATSALEAAAPHMAGYKWPVGDDDNPHRDGNVQPSSHWIMNCDAGWGCSGCDWTGTTLKEYWDAHGKPDECKIPF